MSTEDIYNFRRVSDCVITGGHPTEQQLRDVALDGFDAVVNLAPADHRSVPDEDALVRSLGMSYHYLPVDWQAPTVDDLVAFEQTLQSLGSQRVLIHCAANFRVTAFYSLYARRHLGWSAEQAQALRASIWDAGDHPVWQSFIRSQSPD
jgi:protein tyrosine phosphatase (PTP) superfamily phosphohydrolase (DUF442 family)